MKHLVLTLLFCSIGLGQLSAQLYSTRQVAQQQHVWGSVIAGLDLSPHWILHLEFQERRAEFGKDLQQHLARIGLLYRLDDKHQVGGGYAFIHTSTYGEFPAKLPFDEHRMWVQFQSKEQIKSLGLSHRYRIEFRHIDPENASRNEVRLRYMIRMQIPLIQRERHLFYAALLDEVFINMGKKVAYNVFDQNRASMLLGLTLNKHFAIESGYLNQYVMQRSLNAAGQNKIENNHTLIIALNWVGPLHAGPNQPRSSNTK
jgi:hypothetical protein